MEVLKICNSIRLNLFGVNKACDQRIIKQLFIIIEKKAQPIRFFIERVKNERETPSKSANFGKVAKKGK